MSFNKYFITRSFLLLLLLLLVMGGVFFYNEKIKQKEANLLIKNITKLCNEEGRLKKTKRLITLSNNGRITHKKEIENILKNIKFNSKNSKIINELTDCYAKNKTLNPSQYTKNMIENIFNHNEKILPEYYGRALYSGLIDVIAPFDDKKLIRSLLKSNSYKNSSKSQQEAIRKELGDVYIYYVSLTDLSM